MLPRNIEKIPKKLMVTLIRKNVPQFIIPSNDEDLIFKGWDALCERYRPVFFEKTPQRINHWAALSLILRYMQTTDHDVRIVGLIRNPMAMIYSAWSRWLTPPDERQFMWAQAYRNLLCFKSLLPDDRFHLVRYEDMVAQPQETMKTVCQFLDLRQRLTYHEEIGAGVHSKALVKWFDDQSFSFQLHSGVALIAKHFGYTDDDLYNPPKPQMSPIRRSWLGVVRWYRNTKAHIWRRYVDRRRYYRLDL